MKRQRGFTLIEILVVVAIMAVLAAIGLTSYQAANRKGRDSRRAADIQQVRSALEMFRSDCGVYPATTWAALMGTASYTCNGVPKNFVTDYMGNRPVNDPQLASGHANYTYVMSGGGYTITYTPEVGAIETFTNP